MVISAITTLRSLTDDYEVIVVNDGSSDYTKDILDELEKQYPGLKVIHHPHNGGYGRALRTGFASAAKELIFYTDGDAQYDARELKLLLPALKDGVDVVNGYKIDRSDPLHRVIIGKIYQWGVKFLFGLRLRDVDCDFRLITRSVFDKIKLESDSGAICVEMMRKIQDAGFVVAEIPVHHYHRAYGKSQFFNIRRIYRALVALARLWWQLMIVKRLQRGKNAVS
jgi:glycosyltransferase involved in cell wall biosynthesis